MKKSKVIFLVFIIMLLASLCTVKIVSAGTSGGGEGDPVKTCSNYNWCWGKGVRGIRVSFYDSNGNKISNSLDFYANAFPPDTDWVHYNAPKKSKIEYADGATLNDSSSWQGTYLNNLFVGGLQIVGLYEEGVISDNIFRDFLGISSFQHLVNLFQTYESSFFEGHYTFDDLKNAPNKYYMIVEPTTVIYQVGGKRYYGTYTELQKIYIEQGDGTKWDYSSFYWISSLFNDYGTGSGYYHLAKSVFLNREIEGTGTLANKLNSYKDNTSVTNKDNKYGIAVKWIGELQEGCTGCCPGDPNYESGCVPEIEEFPKCKVVSTIEPCNNKIEIEYTNCLMNNDSNNNITVDELGTSIDACRLVCDEKYSISTYPIVKSFSPAWENNDGDMEYYILAGNYYPLNGPKVEHKKVCTYLSKIDKVNDAISAKIQQQNSALESGTTDEGIFAGGCYYKKTDCVIGEGGVETCTSTWQKHNSCANYWTQLKNDVSTRCTNLKTSLKNTTYELEQSNLDVEQQKGKSLTLMTGSNNFISTFSNYTFKIDDINNPLAIVREPSSTFASKDFGYKNSFTYDLANNINKHISMETIYDNNFSPIPVGSDRYYENATAMGTTPINLQTGKYYFKVNYFNLFSDSFKAIVKNADEGNVDLSLQEGITGKQCEFNVRSRNIKTTCTQNCGDPDKSFIVPSIRMEYRPISLSNPFPGKDGTTRSVGYNWTESDVTKYITENRGVSTDALYFDKEPLYVIDLDGSKINAIKDYNDSNAYDDFTLSCTAGTGEECISNFLRGTLTVGSGFTTNLLSSGTCVDTEAAGYDFYGCADKVKITE